MSHVLATVVFLGGLAAAAWLAWHGRPADGVVSLIGTVAAVCVIGSFGSREQEGERTKRPPASEDRP